MIRNRLALLLIALLLPGTALANLSQRGDVREFIDQLAENHGFDRDEVATLLDHAEVRQEILDLISRPAERTHNWGSYRPIFLTEPRIAGGVDFWNQHHETLARAEAVYGVPAEIIVAIIGVETFYGRHTGRHRVLDALVTLGFDYPPRARFFRSELEHFLLMAREEGFDPRQPMGSYAGAMGIPQFISSSYRAYSVDFSGSGRRDLAGDVADAIGSVANYLARHRWEPEQPVAVPARVDGNGYREVIAAGLEPHTPVAELARQGVTPQRDDGYRGNGALIKLETDAGSEHWLVWRNFYAITRYNHSPLYAMAVYQLSREIRAARAAQ